MSEDASSGKPPKVRLAQGQEVSLGCGTLVLIALIVLIFSGRGAGDLEREVRHLRSELSDLKKAVESQSAEIRRLSDRLPPAKVDGGKAKE
jgi:Sec-independent protein translocase protein TatA